MSRIAKAVRGPLRSAVGVPKRRSSNASGGWPSWSVHYNSGPQFSCAAQDTSCQGVRFHPDGSQMFVVGYLNDKVYEYSLSTEWDVSTASFVKDSSFVGLSGSFGDLDFNSDGSIIYVVDDTTTIIYAHTLSTPWDISTSTGSINLSVAAQVTTVDSLWFGSDGKYLYVTGNAGNVYRYEMSSPYIINTAILDTTFDASTPSSPNVDGAVLDPSGAYMYVQDRTNQVKTQFKLSTPWDLASAVFSTQIETTSSIDGTTFKPDGSLMFILSNDSVRAWEFGGDTNL